MAARRNGFSGKINRANILLMLATFFVFSQNAVGQVTLKKDHLILENEKIKKVIHFSRKKPAGIRVTSLYSKIHDKELLSGEGQTPWFEFVIDGTLTKSSDALWHFDKHVLRKMANGGEEVKMIFEGVKGKVKGLQLIIYNQLFPNSTWVREQLTLKTTGQYNFHLNTLDGELHFVFPQYALKKRPEFKEVVSTEISIASWGAELLDSINHSSYDARRFDGAKYHNLAQAHTFHPKIYRDSLKNGDQKILKGPFAILSNDQFTWITAYEHASQDNLGDPAITDEIPVSTGSKGRISVDGMQKGNIDAEMADLNAMLHMLGIRQHVQPDAMISSVDILQGGYFDNERIDSKNPYRSVWTASAFYEGREKKKRQELTYQYLLKWICENQASRKPKFYYNTWGMQRDEQAKGSDLRGVLTMDRIFKEISYAAELNVDLFVLDDGWEGAQGNWTPHKERLKQGLKPVYNALQKHDMTMGLWFSPQGIAKDTERYREHRDWLIINDQGEPVLGQWNLPVFCFVSDFHDLFVEDCKKLIDQGARFFKWDAINTYICKSALHHHGDQRYSPEKRNERYQYLLPLYVKKVMAELKAYEPELVIEIDVTEDRRSIIGLLPLSEGKIFWMNNGASGYGDYSQYRAKSMRSIPNAYAGIVPLQLFTYANYPHNSFPFFSQRYNVNSSLIAGRGFWGNLELMSREQLLRTGKIVGKAKRVLPYIQETMTNVHGLVGASPEIYTTVNAAAAAGQVIAFSGSALEYDHKVAIDKDKFLAVLNNGYDLNNDSLTLHFQFPMADATREAFIVPHSGQGFSIVSSSSWLDDVRITPKNGLTFIAGAPGLHKIHWPTASGKPDVTSENKIHYTISENNGQGFFEVRVTTYKKGTKVLIRP